MDNETFFKWYQEQLVYMLNDGGSLIYLFSQLTDFNDYNKKWAQNCLDFAYRVIKCQLCEFGWGDLDNLQILLNIAKDDPLDGIEWHGYELVVSKSGEAFLLECGVDGKTEEFSPLLKEKLTKLCAEHGVGFDKSCFIPIQF